MTCEVRGRYRCCKGGEVCGRCRKGRVRCVVGVISDL